MVRLFKTFPNTVQKMAVQLDAPTSNASQFGVLHSLTTHLCY